MNFHASLQAFLMICFVYLPGESRAGNWRQNGDQTNTESASQNSSDTALGAPLRIKSQDITISLETSGGQRIGDMIRVLSAVRNGNTLEATYTNDEAESTIATLESEKRKGNLFDMPTLLLGLLQTPRIDTQGTDRAHFLVEILGLKIASTTPGSQYARKCLVEGAVCHDTRIKDIQGLALVVRVVPITPNMNALQSIGIDTSMASVVGYIATMRRPELVTSGTRTPVQVLAADRAENPNVDIVKSNREQFRACIRRDDPANIDLKKCAKIGARAAIYNLALTGQPFVENDPLQLVPTPDLPKSMREAFFRERPALRRFLPQPR